MQELYTDPLLRQHFGARAPTLEQLLKALTELGKLTLERVRASASNRNPASYQTTLHLHASAQPVRTIVQYGLTPTHSALRCMLQALREHSMDSERCFEQLQQLLSQH